MKRQRALNLIVGVTIALTAIGGCANAEPPRGGNNNNNRRPASSASTTTRGVGRPPSSSSKKSNRGDERPRKGSGGSGVSGVSTSSSRQQQSQRSVEDILDLDDLLLDDTSFNLDDDVDALMMDGGSSRYNNRADNNNVYVDDIDYDEFDYDEGRDELFDPLPPYDEEPVGGPMGGVGGDQDNSNNGVGSSDGLMGLGGGDQDEYGQGSEKGALYDAYNLLHSLAQVSCSSLSVQANLFLEMGSSLEIYWHGVVEAVAPSMYAGVSFRVWLDGL